jgi:hypothetical protein
VAAGVHKRQVNGILGLLCREHFPSLVEYVRVLEPAYTWEHYIAIPDAQDRNGRVFANKAKQVKAKLWVSLLPTTLLNTSHSLDILEIMTGYIASICRISLDARRDFRTGRLMWLTKSVTNS